METQLNKIFPTVRLSATESRMRLSIFERSAPLGSIGSSFCDADVRFQFVKNMQAAIRATMNAKISRAGTDFQAAGPLEGTGASRAGGDLRGL